MSSNEPKPPGNTPPPPEPSDAMPFPPANEAPSPGPMMPGDGPAALPPPPSFGRQMAQLVIIPAVIVICCIITAVLFGRLAGSETNIDVHLTKLRQSSGAGKMAFDLQDPRYKDRWLAAYNVATLIPSIKDPQEQARVGDELVAVLRDHTEPHEELLESYLLVAVGQLGQPGGLEIVLDRLASPRDRVVEGAISGLLSWPNAQQARAGLPPLIAALKREPVVASQAAAALGQLAQRGDQAVLEALADAMTIVGSDRREVQWNAAVALARLDDARGSRFVVDVLLDRETLAQMTAAEKGPQAQQPMPTRTQEAIILATLGAAGHMNDPAIWVKIQQIAEHDPSTALRNAAQQLLVSRQQDG